MCTLCNNVVPLAGYTVFFFMGSTWSCLVSRRFPSLGVAGTCFVPRMDQLVVVVRVLLPSVGCAYPATAVKKGEFFLCSTLGTQIKQSHNLVPQ